MVDSSSQFIENQNTHRHNNTSQFQSFDTYKLTAYNSMVHKVPTIPMSGEYLEKKEEVLNK